MKTIGHGHASGKIILMGEHAVVYGEPAIAFPFSGTGIDTTIQLHSQESWIQSSFYHGPLTQAPATMRNVTALVWQLIRHFAVQEPFYITIDSTIPAERGMGSSAAVAVSITRAFFDWMEIPAAQTDILYFVHQAEKIAHGNPSGIDATTISGTEPLLYQKGLDFQPFELNMDAFLVVADTGFKGQTRKAVKDVAQLMNTQFSTTAPRIREIGWLTKTAQQAILLNQPHRLGDCMNQAQEQLRILGTSNDALDHLIDTALMHQALGAKLTGGGRGGCMIALAENEAQGRHLQTILSRAGARDTWIEGLGVYAHA
ncbi:mevalonate kinase [Enterococcus florum]|uniref:Mevalonate kinase n=1 Tax=Enterococcus florum TaxID=2480627 RepID=A0A4V0WPG9_9ENTE|nr:mevalonate kinase [Enterococcus florum]GCF93819.1 mevalonate kinase [Enterococcus florum]